MLWVTSEQLPTPYPASVLEFIPQVSSFHEIMHNPSYKYLVFFFFFLQVHWLCPPCTSSMVDLRFLKDLNFIKEKKKHFQKQRGNSVTINFRLLDARLSPWWRFRRVLGFRKEHCAGGVCGAGVLWGPRAWRLSTPRPPTLPSLGDAAQACQPLHTCSLCTSLPPTVHIASCWNLPSCLCAAQVFLSPSGFTHLGLTPLQPFPPDALTLASNSKMAAGHQRGPNRVSPPLDCELLQRDLGHRRVESQHYSLPDAWLATNMCCCCFLK